MILNFRFLLHLPVCKMQWYNLGMISLLCMVLICCMDTLGILIGKKKGNFRMNMTWKRLCPLLRKMDSRIFPSIVSKHCLFVLFLTTLFSLSWRLHWSQSNLFSYFDFSFRGFYKKIIYDRLKLCILPLYWAFIKE